MKNLLREKLLKGEKAVGTFFELGSANAVECLGAAGMDFMIIDAEHGPFEAESAADFVRTAVLRSITPFVRIKDCSRPAVLKMLDIGAEGLIVPSVDTVDEVRELVSYAKYFPIGERGVMWGRDALWGYADYASGNMQDYFDTCNRETLLIPQCETMGALEHIEEITSMDGVDGIFVGPYDLSVALGKPGDFGTEEFVEAVESTLDACRAAGKISIIFTGDTAAAKRYFDQGFDAVTVSMDTKFLINAAREVREKALKGF